MKAFECVGMTVAGMTIAGGEGDAKSENKDEKMHGYSLPFDAIITLAE